MEHPINTASNVGPECDTLWFPTQIKVPPMDKTKDFTIRAKAVHGDIYSYDKVQYIDKDTPVTVTCSIHGDFQTKPRNHLRGLECRDCVLDIIALSAEVRRLS